ncbi:uncharacterized protein TNCV_2733231 [Trichonephila clavipes]|nr:uncharacterized protein TNCV_2733231 [Trichonephila clavipes]
MWKCKNLKLSKKSNFTFPTALKVVEEKAMDYAQLKQALTEQFPVENWLDTKVETRYHAASRPQRESNRLGGVGDNRRFDSRRQSGYRLNNHGGRQGSLRNGAFRGQAFQLVSNRGGSQSPPDIERHPWIFLMFPFFHHSPVGHKSFISEEVYRSYFSHRPRQRTAHLGWFELQMFRKPGNFIFLIMCSINTFSELIL